MAAPVVSLIFFLMIRPPPTSTLFPTRRSSDLRPGTGDRQHQCGAAGTGTDSPVGEESRPVQQRHQDRKSTRLNSSHPSISYAVFCLKNKKPASTPHPLPSPRQPTQLSTATRLP